MVKQSEKETHDTRRERLSFPGQETLSRITFLQVADRGAPVRVGQHFITVGEHAGHVSHPVTVYSPHVWTDKEVIAKVKLMGYLDRRSLTDCHLAVYRDGVRRRSVER